MTQPPDKPTAQPRATVERLIALVLRAGVITSIAIISFGTTLSFIHHADYLSSSSQLQSLTRPGGAFPPTFSELRSQLLLLRGQAIVTLGLLLLIATPVLRVAISILVFLVEGDRLFALITFVVLTLLVLSFFLGGAM